MKTDLSSYFIFILKLPKYKLSNADYKAGILYCSAGHLEDPSSNLVLFWVNRILIIHPNYISLAIPTCLVYMYYFIYIVTVLVKVLLCFFGVFSVRCPFQVTVPHLPLLSKCGIILLCQPCRAELASYLCFAWLLFAIFYLFSKVLLFCSVRIQVLPLLYYLQSFMQFLILMQSIFSPVVLVTLLHWRG